jgi:Rrf2 family nitric oxide-sensitive transcriptional repressor
MRLTAFSDYSLRVLIYLAHAPEGRATIAEIAQAFSISEHHLVKVVHQLGRQGILANTRGRHGGVRLAKPAREINVGAVLRLTEGGADMPAECFDRKTNTCALAGGCGLQHAFRKALEQFYAALDRYSVADLDMAPRKLSRIFMSRRAP